MLPFNLEAQITSTRMLLGWDEAGVPRPAWTRTLLLWDDSVNHPPATPQKNSTLNFIFLFIRQQLQEANDLLRSESDTAARLRKSQSEMTKSISQLETLNRELQERSRTADGEKAQLEKELLLLQSSLDSERRNYSQGSEEIRELQGDLLTLIQLSLQETMTSNQSSIK